MAKELGGAYRYSYRGVDFTNKVTGAQVELTTVGDLAAHQATYGPVSPILDYVTYTLP